jgi:hypothetical protein
MTSVKLARALRFRICVAAVHREMLPFCESARVRHQSPQDVLSCVALISPDVWRWRFAEEFFSSES